MKPGLQRGTAIWVGWLLAGTAGPRCLAAEPLTPSAERASFRLADDRLIVELVAAEPDVTSPVAVAWDADGRLFVAEMSDYPTAAEGGQIKLLEDRDGDGRYERVSVFADHLPFPNGVLPWKDGVLVTAAPDIWFLKDTNGDGRADERRVLFTGFAPGNQQLRVNGLLWGLDNWIYGANGRSDGEVRPAGHPAAAAISLRGHDFRLRPDTGEFEAVAGRSQFGLAQDDWGNRFLSWNTIPIRHEVLPERFLNRNPRLAVTESLQDLLEPGDTGRVFPLTPPPLTFNNESTSHFNALAGLHVYRGDALGPAYAGNAFVGESLRNLVHRRVLEPSGPTFVARRAEQAREFLASEDPWFHPVNFATGPDGALYVVDFYRRFVEHPDFVHGKARDVTPWRTGAEHGRLWRIRLEESRPASARPRLSRASSAELVAALEQPNGWWRDTAQRLLVERQDPRVAPALNQMARHSTVPQARLQALRVLDGLGALGPDSLRAALSDTHPQVRANALRLIADSDRWPSVLAPSLPRLARDPDPRVRFQLALAMGQAGAGSGAVPELIRLAGQDATNRWHALAILSGLHDNALRFWEGFVRAEPRWLQAPNSAQAPFVEQISRLAALTAESHGVEAMLDELTGIADRRGSAGGWGVAFAGFAEGSLRRPDRARDLGWTNSSLTGLRVRHLMERAAAIPLDPAQPLQNRLAALRAISHGPAEIAHRVIPELLKASAPAELQTAAARSLAAVMDGGLVREILAGSKQYTRATLRAVCASAVRTPPGQTELIEALAAGSVQAAELDATVRQSLLRIADRPLRQRAEALLQRPGGSDRERVIQTYRAALQKSGDRRRGAAVFARICLSCHALQGAGQAVGPDLSGLSSRPKEAVLIDVLDPSRQVSPEFLSYSFVTTAGETLTGLMAAETATSVTLRRAGQPDETLLRSQIKELRAEGKSLMPDGLEQGLNGTDLEDLLEFLGQPEAALLPSSH